MRFCLLLFLSLPFLVFAQNSYIDSLSRFQQQYVEAHEVVTGANKTNMKFFPVQEQYRITAAFERTENSPWLLMNSTGTERKQYRVYGIIRFTLHDTAVELQIYQSRSLLTSEKYSEHLFIPFTDKTSGYETYGGGRYLDLNIGDISHNTYVIDFNKAYNPYCAYAAGYNCPIPPKENDLSVAVKAGELNYLK